MKHKSLTECPECKNLHILTELGRIEIYMPNSNINNWKKTQRVKCECDCGYKFWYYWQTGRITRRAR